MNPRIMPLSQDIAADKPSGDEANERWSQVIEDFLKWRKEHWNGDQDWELSYMDVRGKYKDSMYSEKDLIVVNETGSMQDQFFSYLFHDNAAYYCEADYTDHYLSAILGENTLNYFWDVCKMQRQTDRAGRDAITCGHGVIRTGFTLEIDSAKAPATQGEMPRADYIKKQAPYIRRVSPFNFLIDHEAPEYDLASARWCGEAHFRPYYDIINNDRYIKSVQKAIYDGKYSPKKYQAPTDSWLDAPSDKQADRIKVFEIWDKRFRKRYEFVEGIDDPLMEGDWLYPYLDEFPYSMLEFIPVADCHYPIGLPRWIRQQQSELNRNRTQMFAWRRRIANQIFEALKGQIEQTELDKWENAEMGALIEVAVKSAISAIQIPALPPDLFQVEGKIMSDMMRLTGLDELARGGALPSRTSATEVNKRADMLTLKTRARRRFVDSWIAQIGTQVLAHCQENMFKEQMIKINGPIGEFWKNANQEGSTLFATDPRSDATYAKVRGADLRGQYHVRVHSTAMPDTDPDTLKNTLLQLMQLELQNAQVLSQSGAMPDFKEQLRELYRRSGIKDLPRFLPWAITTEQPITTSSTPQAEQPALPPAQPQPVAPASPISGAMGGPAGAVMGGGLNVPQ